GDPRMLPLIFNNLLGNAIKFTKEGFVKIDLDLIQDRYGDEVVSVSIEDSGIGIPPDKLSAIFEAFQQGNSGYNRSHEGTGLGLAIAQKYTRLLGGNIQVESILEKGSKFIVRLPLRK
ncbi:MAG: ATP-binding protein, partial [Bacteroidota bacterium]